MSEDKNKARAAILQRRARLMAMTLATVSTGTACGGKVEGERQNTNGDTTHGPGVCLTMICLQPPYEPCLDYPCLGVGGSQVCLSYPYTGGAGGTGGAEVCLSYPYTGGTGGGEGLGGEGGAAMDEDADPEGSEGTP